MAVGLKPKLLPVVTVAMPGTPVQFSVIHTEFQSTLIQADPANTGNIYIGDSTVSASTGISLAPGEKLGIDGLRRARAGDDSFYYDVWYADTDSGGNKLRILNTMSQ